ncbi:hypothetical protein JDV02_006972 [Purpureocillium takamizusanense]|uniref:Uncharacterized protein n=1 Tax=Purpureocillium takamizusanense TaxID=2060973 RepID=A0A9Q8QLD5_9HYPO|nr:uncharacterized protein JDV02_006972 [Purpureocillium takamizusanense]UNI20926.1 hypothetical protein JDV02_006972 [Purpureocillium takamizusanense]
MSIPFNNCTFDGDGVWWSNDRRLQGVASLTTQQLLSRNGNVTSTRSVHRCAGGGHQMNLVAPLSGTPGAAHIVTNMPITLLSAAQTVMRRMSTRSIIAILIGNDEGQGRRIRDGKYTTLIDVDLRPTRLAPDANASPHVFGEPRGVPATIERRCAGCGSLTHELKLCMQSSSDGLLHGCTLCNSISHELDQCRRFRELDLETCFAVLVRQRGNMPALATTRSWFAVLSDYRDAASDVSANYLPCVPYLPWTPEFARRMSQAAPSERARMELFYRDFDRSVLPGDPDTRHLSAARAYFTRSRSTQHYLAPF